MINAFTAAIRFIATANIQYWESVLMLIGDDPSGYGTLPVYEPNGAAL